MYDENILGILQALEARLNSDEYENGGVFSVGGGTNSYVVRSPYNTECEYAIFGAYAFGATASGIIVVSSSNPGASQISATTTPTFGLASVGSESNALDGFYIPVSLTQGFMPFEYWQPLGRGISVNVGITMSAGVGYVLIGFRRKLDRAIPKPPIRQPHTHTAPMSRRGTRTFMQGFEAQYPEDTYVHELIPESNDPATVGNVENAPTPAQVLLARMRDAKGGRR